MHHLLRRRWLLGLAVVAVVAALSVSGCVSSGDDDDDEAEVVETDDNGEDTEEGEEDPPPQEEEPGISGLGVLEEGTFTAEAIDLGLDRIAAEGTTAVRVWVVDADDEPVTEELDVRFSSDCSDSGDAEIEETVTAVEGEAETTYTAGPGCHDEDVIRAELDVGDTELVAEGTVEIREPEIHSLRFESVDPEHIGLQDMPGVLPQTADVTFVLHDVNGEPIAGRTVDFSLATTVGGMELVEESAETDESGEVVAQVHSGTVATPVRVRAQTRNWDLATQSERLWVGTGIPESRGVSLAVERQNPPAYECDGVTVEVTVRARDRFSHPVADGTVFSFSTEGGRIDGSCQTEDGECSVTWVSQNPRPELGDEDRPGRSSIVAYALGEESFTDQTGDGRFGPDEASAGDWDDVGEPFRDDTESGSFERGVDGFFHDFHESGQFDGPNNRFDGLGCQADDGTCGEDFAPVSQQTVLVMASGQLELGSDAFAASSWSIKSDGNDLPFTLADRHGNAPPEGTEVTLEMAEGTPVAGSYTVPNTREPVSGAFVLPDEIDEDESGVCTRAVITAEPPTDNGCGGSPVSKSLEICEQ